LRLEAIDETRSRLKTAANTTARTLKEAEAARGAAGDSLRRSLDLATLKADEFVDAVNKHRKALGLDPVAELTATTSLSSGVAREKEGRGGPSKDSARRELAAIAEGLSAASEPNPHVTSLLEALQ